MATSYLIPSAGLDSLHKNELIFELRARSLSIDVNSSVYHLRRNLRVALRYGIEPDLIKFARELRLDECAEEWSTISHFIKETKTVVSQLEEQPLSLHEVVRLKCRIYHFKNKLYRLLYVTPDYVDAQRAIANSLNKLDCCLEIFEFMYDQIELEKFSRDVELKLSLDDEKLCKMLDLDVDLEVCNFVPVSRNSDCQNGNVLAPSLSLSDNEVKCSVDDSEKINNALQECELDGVSELFSKNDVDSAVNSRLKCDCEKENSLVSCSNDNENELTCSCEQSDFVNCSCPVNTELENNPSCECEKTIDSSMKQKHFTILGKITDNNVSYPKTECNMNSEIFQGTDTLIHRNDNSQPDAVSNLYRPTNHNRTGNNASQNKRVYCDKSPLLEPRQLRNSLNRPAALHSKTFCRIYLPKWTTPVRAKFKSKASRHRKRPDVRWPTRQKTNRRKLHHPPIRWKL